jgi:RHS repeat-associated protein
LADEVRHVHGGRPVIQERNGGSTPTVSNPRGTDLSGTLEGAGGWASQALRIWSPNKPCRFAACSGGLLGRSHGYSGGTGNWSTHNHYHADGNGNITYVVNSSQGLAASYRYDPFGNTTAQSGTLANANVYRFSSKELHVRSGLYYYGHRFYDPPTQRWPNRDPLGELGFELMRRANPWERTRSRGIPAELSQGPNRYIYVMNDPANSIDPYGLWSFYKWLYTGDGNTSDEVYDEALDDAAGYVNCYLDCLKKDNKCAVAWAGSIGAAGIGYGATPRPIANLISPRAALGGSFWKSGVRAIGLRLWDTFGTRSAGSLFLDEAAAFKNAGALGRAGRIGVAGAAIAETGFAIHCAIKCSQQQP